MTFRIQYVISAPQHGEDGVYLNEVIKDHTFESQGAAEIGLALMLMMYGKFPPLPIGITEDGGGAVVLDHSMFEHPYFNVPNLSDENIGEFSQAVMDNPQKFVIIKPNGEIVVTEDHPDDHRTVVDHSTHEHASRPDAPNSETDTDFSL